MATLKNGTRNGRLRKVSRLALAAVAVLSLGSIARVLLPPERHAEPTLVTEMSVDIESQADWVGLPTHYENVGRRLEARPYLGVTYVPVSPRVAALYDLQVDWGILVTAAAEGGPADRAGVRTGDIILFFSQQALSPDVSFLDVLWHHQPGASVKLVVWRNGRHFTTEAVLGTQ